MAYSKNCTLADPEFMELVHNWQTSPSKYTNLLVEQVYPMLRAMCEKVVGVKPKHIDDSYIQVTASSLVNEVYISLGNGARKKQIDSLRDFYCHLRDLMRAVLFHKHKFANAQKRKLENRNDEQAHFDYKIGVLDKDSTKEIDVVLFDDALSKLKDIDSNIAEALSLRYYTLRTNEEIAFIMGKSVSTIERYILTGKDILSALLQGVEMQPSMTLKVA